MHKMNYGFFVLILNSALWAMEEERPPYICFKVEAKDSLINATLNINIKDLVDAWTLILGDAAKNSAWVAISTTRDQVCILTEAAKSTAIGAMSNLTQSAHERANNVAYGAWDLSLWPLRKILGLLLKE